MNVYEAIQARQTIRDFAPRAVEPELIEKIIHAGFNAPTNNHLRAWHFILLQDKERRKALLDQIIHPLDAKAATRIVNRWQMSDADQRAMYIDAIPKQYQMLYAAGCLLLPCFQQAKPLLKPKDLSALNGFASIWCCIENILVAAAAEGIFGVMRIPGEEERQIIKEFCAIPTDYEVPCYLALGYPAEGATRAKQLEIPVRERIHVDKWN